MTPGCCVTREPEADLGVGSDAADSSGGHRMAADHVLLAALKIYVLFLGHKKFKKKKFKGEIEKLTVTKA